ncbi:MAG: zinc-ribbon domain-containing protein [Gemmatimonadetes bacterium]|nr:zinc-ribbon domain-containing protein [Gemmatimonadota bacterium]
MQFTLRCPECKTEFRIDRSGIPPGGFEAKCWSCSTTIPVEAPATGPSEGETVDVTSVAEPHPQPARPADTPPVVTRHMIPTPSDREELLEMMLVSERERREMAWEMTRELFRIRESVERQQMVVAKLVDRVFNQHSSPSLHDELSLNDPPAKSNHAPPAEQVESPEAAAERAALVARQTEMEGQLNELQTTLDNEKRVIDRLRRGKLELERRAAEAETTLKTLRHRGFIDRVLGREID